MWRNHLGEAFILSHENPAAVTPGVVDQEDYDFWKSSYGNSGSGSHALSSRGQIPEPSSWLILMSFAVMLVGQTRKVRHGST